MLEEKTQYSRGGEEGRGRVNLTVCMVREG